MAGYLFSNSPCHATSVGISTVEQPINLGIKSDPTRIPLGAVGVINNHNYGIRTIITAARVCPDGPMQWDGGSELNQNLASVFGISVNPTDSTQVPELPVNVNLKSWKAPAYSPYTKDQVLAATIWCLVRSAGGTPKTPLIVQVVADSADDKHLEAKYSGEYVTRPDKEGEVVPPVKIAGTLLEQDALGITWVTFPEIPGKDLSEPINPGLIILSNDGEDDRKGFRMIPVWGNGEGNRDPLEFTSRYASLLYSTFEPKGVGESNSFAFEGGSISFKAKRSEDGDSILIGHPQGSETTLAACILALVIADQPTEKRSLTVTIGMEQTQLPRFPAFRNLAEWKETAQIYDNIQLECELVWDPSAKKLTKGAVPLVAFREDGWIDLVTAKMPDDEEARSLARVVQDRIKQGIHTGTLMAETNMPETTLHKAGLPREVGKAGFYAALATYSNRTRLPDASPAQPISLGDNLLDQYFKNGWMIGLGKAEAIAIEARKDLTE